MKKQIRQGVFETNSSSTHVIAIATDTKYPLPDKVEFGFGDFGWEFDKLTSRKERANYLYTCLAYVGEDKLKECLQFIFTTLKSHGISAYFEDFRLSPFAWSTDDEVEFYLEPAEGTYVDHGNEAREFVEAVCSDEKLLLDYLFSDKSYVLTGNDNDDRDVTINEDYPHLEFYKGN